MLFQGKLQPAKSFWSSAERREKFHVTSSNHSNAHRLQFALKQHNSDKYTVDKQHKYLKIYTVKNFGVVESYPNFKVKLPLKQANIREN